MKGITCSEAKDILEKFNRLERLRQGTKTEMAAVCKEPEKGVNPFGDEFKDYGEQILPERNGIFWDLWRFFGCKHTWLTLFFLLFILLCMDTEPQYWIYIPLALLLVAGAFIFFIWLSFMISPLTPKQGEQCDNIGIMNELAETNGKVPKGRTKEECLRAVDSCALATYKYLKEKGRI